MDFRPFCEDEVNALKVKISTLERLREDEERLRLKEREDNTFMMEKNMMNDNLNCIELFMVSVNRDPNYIFETLSSFFLVNHSEFAPHLRIMLGSTEQDHLHQYVKLKHRMKIIPISKEEEKHLTKKHVPYKAAYNYLRALKSEYPTPQCKGKVKGRLIIEDDILFSFNFWNHLVNITNQIEDMGHDKYVLTLYVPSFYKNLPSNYFYVPEFWCCSQAVFYSQEILPELVEASEKNLRSYSYAYDQVIRDEMMMKNYTAFRVGQSLVQHLGARHSTGTGAGGHWAHFDINY